MAATVTSNRKQTTSRGPLPKKMAAPKPKKAETPGTAKALGVMGRLMFGGKKK